MIFDVLILSACLDSRRWRDGGGELLDLCVVLCVNGSSVLGPEAAPLVSCVHELGRDVGCYSCPLVFM